jgi:uncharacterized protein
MELSDAERLTLLMLCDIYERVGIDDSFDPAFIRKAVSDGETWALRWRYGHLFGVRETTDDEVHEVTNILEMWDRIEWSYEQLEPEDQETVNAAHYGHAPTFHGFDGNNETTEMGVADMLINTWTAGSGSRAAI